MENINTDEIKYRKTKLVKSKNGTEYRRLYYAHEEVDKIPENILPKQEVKNHYIKTVSKNGKTYYKHPTELYKELHRKNYEKTKEKKCRQIFLRNLKKTTRAPHDKSILYYELTEEEVQKIREERITNDPANKESLRKIYDTIIDKIRTLKK
jgi:hypothetical protein